MLEIHQRIGYICGWVCPEKFKERSRHEHHLKVHKHDNNNSKTRPHVEDPLNQYLLCGYVCEEWFSRWESLERHKNAVHMHQKYKCEECGKSCSREDLLTRHRKMFHSNEKHACSICPAYFTQRWILERHNNIGKHDWSEIYCKFCQEKLTFKNETEEYRHFWYIWSKNGSICEPVSCKKKGLHNFDHRTLMTKIFSGPPKNRPFYHFYYNGEVKLSGNHTTNQGYGCLLHQSTTCQKCRYILCDARDIDRMRRKKAWRQNNV